MKDNNYIVLQGWMVSQLHLTGNALMVYACIFGFSQGGEWYTGTAGYLAEWCDCQKKYMLKLLKKMTDEGLLRKRTRERERRDLLRISGNHPRRALRTSKKRF